MAIATEGALHIGHAYAKTDLYTGIGLAIVASIFNGSGGVIVKKSLLRNREKGNLSAAAGGYGYLKEWLWWAGLMTTSVSEVLNLGAYALAPATVVSPLGGLGILVNAVLSTYCLQEKLNLLGKLGCFLCIVGATVIVLHAPKSTAIDSPSVLQENLLLPEFIAYAILALAACVVIVMYLGPRYGDTNVAVYATLSSLMGSFSVVAAKGLGIIVKDSYNGNSNEIFSWMPILFIAILVITGLMQLKYMNKALDLFNTAIILPFLYVSFTTYIMILTSILFKEWQGMSDVDIVGCVCGVLTIVVAICLLLVFSELDISIADIKKFLKPKTPNSLKAKLEDLGVDNKALDLSCS